MITFQKELLCQVVQEMQPMLEAHYRELCLHQDRIKLNPRWDQYAALERMDAFIVLTARDEGKLVGYSAYFLNQHIHYADLSVAQNDVFYVVEALRKGMTPVRFLKYCEQTLIDIGVRKAVYHAKLENNFAPLLCRMGYAQEEVMCAKMI